VEFIVCMLLASILTGGRVATDLIHGVKGTTPPHLEKARLRAQQQAARARGRSPRPGDDKPTFADVARVYRGEIWRDAIDYIERSKEEKRRQQAADRTPRPDGEVAPRVRPSFGERAKRLGKFILNGPEKYWEPKPDAVTLAEPVSAEPAQAQADVSEQPAEQPDEQPAQPKRRPSPRPTTDPNPSSGGTPMSQPTGEASNYEGAIAELHQLADLERACIDQCQAAAAAVQQARASINNMQEAYRTASVAAPLLMEQLAARNLDATALSHAGTTADALPAGVVDAMYDQLEGMEAEAQRRLADAETALASTEANIAHLQATYGDAHATVAGNLGGDASFLASAGGATGSGAGGGGRGGGGDDYVAPVWDQRPDGSVWARYPGDNTTGRAQRGGAGGSSGSAGSGGGGTGRTFNASDAGQGARVTGGTFDSMEFGGKGGAPAGSSGGNGDGVRSVQFNGDTKVGAMTTGPGAPATGSVYGDATDNSK
jgi:hypothetical protein